MSKKTNSVEVKSALNLNNEEVAMLDNQNDWELGQLEIDEADLDKAHLILQAALVENEIGDRDESPRLYNGVDWDKLAHLVEVQLFMRRVMARIEWLNSKLEDANNGNRIPYETFTAFVRERKDLWSKWNSGKALSFSIVGEEKKLWGIFFNIDDLEVFLRNHLEMDVSVWNTYGRDDEEDEGFDKFHVDVIDQLAQSHIAEMKEYDRDVDVNWTYQDNRMNRRMENKVLDQQSLFESCPF